MSLIFGKEEWIIHYRQDKHAIWISAHLDNGERAYIKQNENGSLITWKKIADYCSRMQPDRQKKLSCVRIPFCHTKGF